LRHADCLLGVNQYNGNILGGPSETTPTILHEFHDTVNPTNTSQGLVRLAAVGDLLLCPDPKGVPYLRDSTLISPGVHAILAD